MTAAQCVIRIFPDAEAVSQAAAVEFVRVAREAVASALSQAASASSRAVSASAKRSPSGRSSIGNS